LKNIALPLFHTSQKCNKKRLHGGKPSKLIRIEFLKLKREEKMLNLKKTVKMLKKNRLRLKFIWLKINLLQIYF